MTNVPGPMLCPVDGSTLTMSERSGIEIDYCPQCRGVWLDRGELDKIIERNAAASSPPPAPAVASASPQQVEWGQSARPDKYGHRPHKRRKSFLEELFD